MIYQRMLSEHARLETQIQFLQKQLKKFPPGKLLCAQNGKHLKWYITNGKQKTYLPKSQRTLAEQLATKKYVIKLIEDLSQEKRAIEFYLRHHKEGESIAEELFLQTPEYKKLLLPNFRPLSEELRNWAAQPHETNPKNPENLIFKTASGRMVRSKSEVMIDLFLSVNQIPFRYEAALNLSGITIFPDFTIRHPKTGEYYYWEHFGMMDNPEYLKNVGSKIQLYGEHGIIPSVQLIATYETKEFPLNVELVQELIRFYFL